MGIVEIVRTWLSGAPVGDSDGSKANLAEKIAPAPLEAQQEQPRGMVAETKSLPLPPGECLCGTTINHHPTMRRCQQCGMQLSSPVVIVDPLKRTRESLVGGRSQQSQTPAMMQAMVRILGKL